MSRTLPDQTSAVIEIDSALPGHAPAIAEIHVGTWRAAYQGIVPDAALAALSVERREEYWRTALAEGDPQVLVAGAARAVMGWIAFGACRDDGAPRDSGELWAIYTESGNWSHSTRAPLN